MLAQGDRVRFKFRTNFDGYLYVMNQSTSGTYEQLFPREETGQDNRIAACKEYQVPATSAAFRIAGPAGHEVVYWLVTPARLTDGAPRFQPPPATKVRGAQPHSALRRHHPARARRLRRFLRRPQAGAARRSIPQNLTAQGVDSEQRDLLFMRQKNTAVISSPEPLTGPIIYEFRLAHR